MHVPTDPPTAQRNDPLIGQQIGAFRVDRMLATGGMGAVYLLHHVQHPNTRKVLKVIRAEFAGKPYVRDRFLAEADALSQLGTHPGIVGMDDHFQLPDGQLAILMPFCEGTPLDGYVARHGGKLAPHRAFYVACHVARALHHAHTRGIVHRDLKPNNVFVEDDDNDWARCRLLDFGVARRLNPNPSIPLHTIVGPLGTPDFMPPEQQDRPHEATSAADVFSLAVMIWWMVTGGYPWGTQSDPAILYVRKLNDPPDPPLGDTLTAEWERWLRAALRPDPTARPSLRQLTQALAQSLDSVGRLVPSGAEILQRLARVLWEESGPEDLTLRNRSNRTLLPAWPERGPLHEIAPSTGPLQPSQPPTLNERFAMADRPVPDGPIAPPAPPDALAPSPPRPDPTAPMVTTMGASSGAVVSIRSAPAGWKLALVGVAVVAVVGSGTFALANLRGHHSSGEPTATTQPTPPGALVPTAPAPAAPAPAAPVPTTPVPAAPAPAAPVPTTPAPAASAPAASVPTTPVLTTPAPSALAKRHSAAQPDSTGATATKGKASTSAVDSRIHNNASNSQSSESKFDPDAVVGGEEK